MKKTTIQINYDDEKYRAITMYLQKKEKKIESEVALFMEELYKKYVPSDVRKYLDLTESLKKKPKSLETKDGGKTT